MAKNKNYRFSGHETFPCRYAWLPKAYLAINMNPRIFADTENAMVVMGVGKNMVRAIQFWVQACGVAKPLPDGGYTITDFGGKLLSADGFDPFLEDIRTLWLIHWNLSSHVEEPLFAWDYLLNNWGYIEITRNEVVQAFGREASRLERKLSVITLEQHFDTFLHTYVPTHGEKGNVREDNLDSPLIELELLQKVGERKSNEGGKRETIYAFRREEKSNITSELFLYCLNDFWNKYRATERTLTFRDISVTHGSPGQIFKLPEPSIRERLKSLETDSKGTFIYRESVSAQQVIRDNFEHKDFLAEVYTMEDQNA